MNGMKKREQDWDILEVSIHDAFHHFMQKLNHLYMTTPALSAKTMKTPASIGWTVIRKNAVSTLLKERMARTYLPLSLISRMRIRRL